MSRLTKKQLYGYSLMKWKDKFKKSNNYIIEMLEPCSFCFDVNSNCLKCGIDNELCNDFGGLYVEIDKKHKEYRSLVNMMIRKLTENYNKEK